MPRQSLRAPVADAAAAAAAAVVAAAAAACGRLAAAGKAFENRVGPALEPVAALGAPEPDAGGAGTHQGREPGPCRVHPGASPAPAALPLAGSQGAGLLPKVPSQGRTPPQEGRAAGDQGSGGITGRAQMTSPDGEQTMIGNGTAEPFQALVQTSGHVKANGSRWQQKCGAGIHPPLELPRPQARGQPQKGSWQS